MQPTSSSQASLIGSQTVGITGVTQTSANGSNGGVYCLSAASSINPATVAAVVSPEVSYSSGGTPGVVAVNAQATHCPPSTFEVDTYAPGGTTLTSGYAFSIIVP